MGTSSFKAEIRRFILNSVRLTTIIAYQRNEIKTQHHIQLLEGRTNDWTIWTSQI